MSLVTWSNRIIRWGFYLLFILVPLVLTPVNYELFEYNKMMVTYALTAVIVTAWLVKMLASKEIRIAKTPLDIPILLFLSSQFVSSLFSMDPHVSWFGYYSRFNAGMWSIISYVVLYYAFVSNLTNWSNWTNLLKISLGTAAVIAFYGVLERLGIDKHLWVQDVQNRVFSSLGQPNWLAAYLVALAPIATALSLRGSRLWRETRQPHVLNKQEIASTLRLGSGSRNDIVTFVIWSLIAALFFLVLLFTRSRSGLLGFAVADVVFWGLVFIRPRLAWQGEALRNFIVLHAAFFLIVFFNGTYVNTIDRWFTLRGWQQRFTHQTSSNRQPPTSNRKTSYLAPLLEFGGTESGTIRKYVWQAALNAWKSSAKTFLVGTGTETFAFAFFRFKPVGHNLTSEWDFLYNKAHNEYLNYLATTGIFGLGSYLLFIGAFVWWFIQWCQRVNASTRQRNNIDASDAFDALTPALFAGWLSVLVTNFFGFSVVIVQLFLFLFPAMAIVLNYELGIKNYEWRMISLKLSSQGAKWSSLTLLLVSLVLLVLLARAWWADVQFARSYRLARAGRYTDAQSAISQAIQLNPTEPLFRDEAATTFAALATVASENKQATAAAALARQALEQSDRAIAISPKNVNFWKSRTKVFYTFTAFDEQFNPAAIAALERALVLSPNDPKILYNLAILYGRQTDNARAVELLTQTITLKPNYRDAYFALHIFYKEVKSEQKAREVLERYLEKVNPNDRDFQERLK